MPDEMKTEAMELCVTACEKFSTNNEVMSQSTDTGKTWNMIILNFAKCLLYVFIIIKTNYALFYHTV